MHLRSSFTYLLTDCARVCQAEERHGSAEERLREMEAQLQEKDAEIQRVCMHCIALHPLHSLHSRLVVCWSIDAHLCNCKKLQDGNIELSVSSRRCWALGLQQQ